MLLEKNYRNISRDIRKKILKVLNSAKSAHIGSSLSIVDILVVLYKKFLKKNIFILSKGHACLAYYCVLQKFNYITDKILKSYGKNNTILLSHVSHKVPGVVFSTGSLGHGLPYAVGRALAEKIDKKIIVVEDHFHDGGFQSWLNESTNNKNCKTNIISKSISSLVVNKVGSQEYLMKLLK